MTSNVGSASLHEAGDQRNKSDEEKKQEEPERFEQGKDNAHNATDPSMFGKKTPLSPEKLERIVTLMTGVSLCCRG